MSLWRQITHGLRALTHREAADRDVSDEVQDYLDRAAADFEKSGLSPNAARRAARLECGNPTAIREQAGSYGWERMFGTLAADLHFAARQLLHNPGFALVCILTLAIGIGASTAIFSALNPISVSAAALSACRSPHDRQGPGERWFAPRRPTFGTFHALAEGSRSLEAAAVMKPWQPTMVGVERAGAIRGPACERGILPRAWGLAFTGDEISMHPMTVSAVPNVVVLSDRLWREHFAADSAIVGKQVRLDGSLFTVIGVMPGSFENVLAPAAELWAPLQYDPSLPVDGREWGHHLTMVGRLHPGGQRDAGRR